MANRKKSQKKAPEQHADPSKPLCPECGAPMVRIVYGYPTAETFERSTRGEFALGGCVVTGFDATHVCEQGHRWRRRGRRTGLDPSTLAGVVLPGPKGVSPRPGPTSEWISMADPWDEFFAEVDEADDPDAPPGLADAD